jgi:integrase
MGRLDTCIGTKIPGLYRRGENLIVKKSICGITINENYGPVSVATAEKLLAQRVDEVRRGKYRRDNSGSLTVRDVCRVYYREKMGHMAHGVNSKYLLDNIDRLLGNLPVMNLTISHIDEYKRSRGSERVVRGKNRVEMPYCVGPRSIQADLDQLDCAISWAVKNRYIPSNPIDGYEKVKMPTPEKIMIDSGIEGGAEWKSLYAATCEDLKPIVLCLYETAMRPAEVLQMTWDWVRIKDRVVVIPAECEKTRDGRMVPISNNLLWLFGEMISKPGELVFPSVVTGGKRQTIAKAFHGAVVRAGLDGRGITPYALRRTRLTIWDSIDGRACMAAGDHSQERTHYDHYVNIGAARLLRLVGVTA